MAHSVQSSNKLDKLWHLHMIRSLTINAVQVIIIVIIIIRCLLLQQMLYRCVVCPSVCISVKVKVKVKVDVLATALLTWVRLVSEALYSLGSGRQRPRSPTSKGIDLGSKPPVAVMSSIAEVRWPLLRRGHLQATLRKLLTYYVLRSTQPPTLNGTGDE